MSLPATNKRKPVKKGEERLRLKDRADLSEKQQSYLPEIHRLLPQSPDAEQGVLCSLMLHPERVLEIAQEKGIIPEFFHLPAHVEIYGTIEEMSKSGKPIDFVTLTTELRNKNKLDQVGGHSYITHLSGFLPTAANARHYLDILEEKYTLRQVIATCTEHAARAYDEQDDVPKLVSDLESGVMRISNVRITQESKYESTNNITLRVMDQIEQTIENKGTIGGISTGFTALDKSTDGLHDTDMIVIAGRPSSGKTALAMNIVEHIAIDSRIPCAVFSLEMSRDQLVKRGVLSRARVNWSMVRAGFMAERDYPAINKSATAFGQAPIYINDKSGINPLYIHAVLRRWIREFGIRVAFVDYLQLLRGTKHFKGSEREREVSDISGSMKTCAKDLGIPIVVLAQLNREPDKRAGGKPKLSDLRDSGSIEQDADVVGLLSREEMSCADQEEKERVAGKAILDIAKQRNGPTGDVPLTFFAEFTRFENRATDVVD